MRYHTTVNQFLVLYEPVSVCLMIGLTTLRGMPWFLRTVGVGVLPEVALPWKVRRTLPVRFVPATVAHYPRGVRVGWGWFASLGVVLATIIVVTIVALGTWF